MSVRSLFCWRAERPVLFSLFLAAAGPAAAVYFPNIQYGTPQEIGPGTTYRHASDPSVPWEIDIIEVDQTNANIELTPVLRNGTLERTSSMAARSHAVAAVNAGYFDGSTGASYSHVEIDGKIHYYNVSTKPARSTFGASSNHNSTLVQAAVDSANSTTDPDWSKVIDAIGGGPNLVTNGAVDVRDVEEGFDSSSGIDPYGRQPRTMLGWNTAARKVFLVTVDGRQSGWSVGMTLDEAAKLLIDLGCDRGMNYDGGGSTTCWVNGQVVNRPSDGSERAVVSAWCVVPSYVMDNTDTDFSVTGTWGTSANAGFYNTNSLYHAGNNGLDGATWTSNLARPGQYDVYAWWVAASNRATQAPYDVYHSDGVSTVHVDQRVNGAQWNLLGRYNFPSGTAGAVTLWDAVPSTEYVSADAVKFVYVGPPPTPVHVNSITMSWVRAGKKYQSQAVVNVKDAAGANVSGATVTGDFSGAITQTGASGTTDSTGNATITSTGSISTGTVQFCVTNITGTNLTYDSAANVVTCASHSR